MAPLHRLRRQCRGRALLFCSAVFLAGCTDGPGLLDPKRVADLPKHPGDATGSQWSGLYRSMVLDSSCSCESSACLVEGVLESDALTEVWQMDGLVVLMVGIRTISEAELAGPVYADGSMAAGWVYARPRSAQAGTAVLRLDGVFSTVDGENRLDGEMRTRLEHASRLEGRACEEHLHVRLRSLPTSPGG